LADLKQQALASAFRRADFKIKTAAEVAMGEAEKHFSEKVHAELALWMGIKACWPEDGDAQFAAMKDSL